jgi:hypothetical protein
MKRAGERPTNRGWLDWSPTDRILADSPLTEPSKPTKPGFDGFVGSLSVIPAKIPGRKSGVAEVDSATPRERVMSWSEWKATALNRLFLEQGATRQSGRITAETVRDGQQAPAEDGSGRMNA